MARAQQRLLFLSPIPPPAGGIATWTLGVLESSLRERFEIRVVSTSPSETASVHGTSRLRVDRAADALRILARLFAELIRHRPDILHVNTSYHWAFLRDGAAVWLARSLGVRTIMHFRGGDFPEFAARMPTSLQRLIRATLLRTDRLIALESHTRSFLEASAPPERIRLIPNFVDLREFPARTHSHSGRLRVLFVGWLIEAKGVRELLEAARALPDLEFLLIGGQEPTFRESLREELEALGDRVIVLPPRPRAEVLELYRDADVFVLPTWREGFPNVILEAMAAGLPIVATRVGAIPDAVRDGEEGLLVPLRDPTALAAALRRLADDSALRARMGARARDRAAATYSLEAVVDQLGTLYEELLG